MSRYPFTPYPNSWFQVAWSDELPPRGVKPLYYFGTDLVLFRTESGQASVLDAHCAHMGAHMGCGGKVLGNSIQCPFHSWQYDGTGACTRIPGSNKIPARAQVKSWPVCEVNGIIFVYYHAEGKAPDFEIPKLPEYGSDEWTPYSKTTWKIRTHLQEVLENTVDSAHFIPVHHYEQNPQQIKLEMNDLSYSIDLVAPTKILWKTLDIHVNLRFYGVGHSVVQNREPYPTITVSNVTPVDSEHIVFQHSMLLEKRLNPVLRALTVRGYRRAIAQDIPIWERKVYRSRPVLTDNDRHLMDIRKYCKQFYGPWPQGTATPDNAAHDSAAHEAIQRNKEFISG